jgi:hypothetical protein
MKVALTFGLLALLLLASPATAAQYVHGYYRSSGTYVHPYYRNSPGGTGTAAVTAPSGACGYYTNRAGDSVPRPCGNWRGGDTPPSTATAQCRDGTWSSSEHPQASLTCSYHGGVYSYVGPGAAAANQIETNGRRPGDAPDVKEIPIISPDREIPMPDGPCPYCQAPQK